MSGTNPKRTHEEIEDAEGEVVVTTRWHVDDRAGQRRVADALMMAWGDRPAGCRSVECHLSTDGKQVLTYESWESTRAYEAAIRTGRVDAGEAAADAAATVTERESTISRVHGVRPPTPPGGPYAGCVVLVAISTASAVHQQRAADMIAELSDQAEPGALGGHVLFSADGSRVHLYAEWTSEEAHQEAILRPKFGGPKGIFDAVSGITGLGMNRYQLYRASGPFELLQDPIVVGDAQDYA
jgi:quinol monooxygenase YgiN